MDRRNFISGLALTSASLAVASEKTGAQKDQKAAIVKDETTGNKRPVLISSLNGMQGIDGGYEILRRGGDTLDAVLFPLKVQEDDPNDDSVGLGGLPNEEGEVELDSCCMHGPTRRAGAVAGVRNIKNVCLVAKTVMERTDHLLLVGEGAQRFAVAHGFPKENLLTERSRKIWLLWKETMSNMDSWGPGLTSPDWKPPVEVPPLPPQTGSAPKAPASTYEDAMAERMRRMSQVAADIGIEPEFRMEAIHRVLYPPTGTIHCSAVNEKGEMSGATTTSGLAWKLPGRVGDSPVIGAGSYTDQDVGSAGCTGRGEENIKVCGAHTIVENMRHGMSPTEAGLDVLKRIARNYNNDMTRLRFISIVYYILRKDGAYAGVTLWSGRPNGPRRFAVHDGTKRAENCVALFQGDAIDWPPTPKLPKTS